MLQDEWIQLLPPSLSLAEQAADYYGRNREFLKEYEPKREETCEPGIYDDDSKYGNCLCVRCAWPASPGGECNAEK